MAQPSQLTGCKFNVCIPLSGSCQLFQMFGYLTDSDVVQINHASNYAMRFGFCHVQQMLPR